MAPSKHALPANQKKYPFITEARDGVLIKVRVQPRSSREGIEGVHGGSLKIKLTSPPVEGEANKALIEMLSKLLGIRKSAFTIESGEKSREKVVRVGGVRAREVEEVLSRIMP